jgi:hypothetical protein
MQQKAYNLNLTRKFQSGNLIMANKEGKLHSRPTTIAPNLHIPSHIMQQIVKSLTRKSCRVKKHENSTGNRMTAKSMKPHKIIMHLKSVKSQNKSYDGK